MAPLPVRPNEKQQQVKKTLPEILRRKGLK
jgi:hypothetical protein